MRSRFYCHSVASTDDGRLVIHMSSRSGSGDNSGEKPPVELLIKAPFEAFRDDEVPRQWHHYEIEIRGVGP